MTKMIPEVIWGAVKEETDNPSYHCVDCALSGKNESLTRLYYVSGTQLCMTHAMKQRLDETVPR